MAEMKARTKGPRHHHSRRSQGIFISMGSQALKLDDIDRIFNNNMGSQAPKQYDIVE